MDEVTPYQARLYNAVLFGHTRARVRGTRAVHTLWNSRRFWQTRALGSESELTVIRRRRDTNRDKRTKQAKLLRRLWASRRSWQQNALQLERKLKLVEDLCLAEQIKQRAPVVPMSSDVILHAVDSEFFPRPTGWDELITLIQRAANRGGPDGASV